MYIYLYIYIDRQICVYILYTNPVPFSRYSWLLESLVALVYGCGCIGLTLALSMFISIYLYEYINMCIYGCGFIIQIYRTTIYRVDPFFFTGIRGCSNRQLHSSRAADSSSTPIQPCVMYRVPTAVTIALAFTRYCHHQYCFLYGIQKRGRVGGGARIAQWSCNSVVIGQALQVGG